MKAENYFLIVIFIGMAMVMVFSAGFPFWQAKLAPLTVAGVIAILTVTQLIKDVVGPRAELRGEKKDKTKSEIEENQRLYFIEGLWVIGFFVCIYLIGFLVSIPLFGISYMKSHGARLSLAATISVLITLFCYVVFSYILGVRFYGGVFFD